MNEQLVLKALDNILSDAYEQLSGKGIMDKAYISGLYDMADAMFEVIEKDKGEEGEELSDSMTFTINDADLDKLNEIIKDINVKECPWFEIRDKHGNKAKYYREPRKKGKWLLIDAGYYDYVKCSQCGETLVWGKNFCPNCGADMRGERDE